MPQRGTHYRSRFLFLFFVVARPLAFGSFPAPMHHPKGGAYVHPFGVHITRVRLTGTPSGCPIMCTLRVHIWVPHRGTHLRHIISFLRGRTSTRLRLVPGSYAHPMGVHMGAPSGHPLQHVQKVHPLGDNPFGVNFGQNYRDLGHFVRVTFFWPKLPAPLRGTSMGTPQGYPYVGTLSGTHISGQFLFFLREIIAPSGQACMHVVARRWQDAGTHISLGSTS